MSVRSVWVSLLVLVLAAGLGWSQEARGTILGRVTDSTGAVIPAVSVRITNVATGVTISLESNDQGNYLAPTGSSPRRPVSNAWSGRASSCA